MLDLVHPSLFCAVTGVTRIVPKAEQDKDWRELMGTGKPVTDLPKPRTHAAYLSQKFQWLPSDVVVDSEGNAVFDSYINNLHPDDNTDLYEILAKILSHFIPMFNKVLTQARNPWKNLIDVYPDDWYPHMEEFRNGDDISDDELWDRYIELRVPTQPTIPEAFVTPPPFPDPVELRGRRLQVITKLANIVLTPEKPSYDGGSWHVEGMGNECIVASGIYYYQNENVTESRLRFRRCIEEPDYEQNDDRGIRIVYGLEDEDPLNEDCGYVVCNE